MCEWCEPESGLGLLGLVVKERELGGGIAIGSVESWGGVGVV